MKGEEDDSSVVQRTGYSEAGSLDFGWNERREGPEKDEGEERRDCSRGMRRDKAREYLSSEV